VRSVVHPAQDCPQQRCSSGTAGEPGLCLQSLPLLLFQYLDFLVTGHYQEYPCTPSIIDLLSLNWSNSLLNLLISAGLPPPGTTHSRSSPPAKYKKYLLSSGLLSFLSYFQLDTFFSVRLESLDINPTTCWFQHTPHLPSPLPAEVLAHAMSS